MIEDLENTSIYLQKHFQHNAEEEEEEGNGEETTKRLKTHSSPTHTVHAVTHQACSIRIITEQYNIHHILKSKADMKALNIDLSLSNVKMMERKW